MRYDFDSLSTFLPFLKGGRGDFTPSTLKSSVLLIPLSRKGRGELLHKGLIGLLAALLLFGAFSGAMAAEAQLPADARQAFDKGLMAAEQEAWETAILYFTQARKSAERNPRILYFLGLAHSRAGHEPAAAAWMRAYLAAEPKAPDADAVRKEIDRLEAAAGEDMKKIYGTAFSAALQVPSPEIRITRLYNLCVSQMNTGEFEGFQKTRDELSKALAPEKQDNVKGYFLWPNYLVYLIEAGEFQKANDLIQPIDDYDLRNQALLTIAKGRISFGDCSSAKIGLDDLDLTWETLKNISMEHMTKGVDTETAAWNLREYAKFKMFIADGYAEAGRENDYRKVLTAADQIAMRYNMEPEIRSKIALAQAKDPKSMDRCSTRPRLDPVKEWIGLAEETSADKAAVDLKGMLIAAKKETSSDALSNGLTSVAEALGMRMKRIHALEKKCEIALKKS